MKKLLVLLVSLCVLASIVAGCGTTPEPTEPPPTQTPVIIILTPTLAPEKPTVAEPTKAVEAASPTPEPTKAPPTPTEAATAEPEATTGATVEPTETTAAATDEPTAAPPSPPTNTPEVGAIKYPPPVLLEPPANRPVTWRSTVLLIWNSVGELAEDEFYHLHMERRPQTEGQEWYGDYVYTKDTEYLAEGAFLDPFHPPTEQGQGVIYWWVRVVRKTGEDANGKSIGIDISPLSEQRTLILDPKP